jgi:hypothetical protein
MLILIDRVSPNWPVGRYAAESHEIGKRRMGVGYGPRSIKAPIRKMTRSHVREEIAHRVAWAAVKKRYRKIGDFWIEK